MVVSDNEKGRQRRPFFVASHDGTKKAAEILLLFCRSGPTRTGDRLHPMQEC